MFLLLFFEVIWGSCLCLRTMTPWGKASILQIFTKLCSMERYKSWVACNHSLFVATAGVFVIAVALLRCNLQHWRLGTAVLAGFGMVILILNSSLVEQSWLQGALRPSAVCRQPNKLPDWLITPFVLLIKAMPVKHYSIYWQIEANQAHPFYRKSICSYIVL